MKSTLNYKVIEIILIQRTRWKESVQEVVKSDLKLKVFGFGINCSVLYDSVPCRRFCGGRKWSYLD
jgi:hypothetical protein